MSNFVRQRAIGHQQNQAIFSLKINNFPAPTKPQIGIKIKKSQASDTYYCLYEQFFQNEPSAVASGGYNLCTTSTFS